MMVYMVKLNYTILENGQEKHYEENATIGDVVDMVEARKKAIQFIKDCTPDGYKITSMKAQTKIAIPYEELDIEKLRNLARNEVLSRKTVDNILNESRATSTLTSVGNVIVFNSKQAYDTFKAFEYNSQALERGL